MTENWYHIYRAQMTMVDTGHGWTQLARFIFEEGEIRVKSEMLPYLSIITRRKTKETITPDGFYAPAIGRNRCKVFKNNRRVKIFLKQIKENMLHLPVDELSKIHL